jgi:tetratricopeptide (TPR) repeat protein
MNKDPLRIKASARHSPLESTIKIGNESFLVITEPSARGAEVTTRVCRKGQIVTTRKNACTEKEAAKISDFMAAQHEIAIKILRKEMVDRVKHSADYLVDIRKLLKEKKYRAAMDIVDDALQHDGNDPFLLSFSGYLEARLFRRYKEGIDTCKRAIGLLGPKVPFGQEFFLPLLYLNLGKAYVEAGKRRGAVAAFKKGLSMDPENKDLLWETKKLGMRKPPIVPFLDRSNPLNKYLGIVRHKLTKGSQA